MARGGTFSHFSPPSFRLTDQPFWGARCSRSRRRRDVPLREADRRSPRAGLAAVPPGPRERAQALGRRLRHEDGLAAAVRVVEEILPRAKYPWGRRLSA